MADESIEAWLNRVKKSPVTWLIGGVISLSTVGAVNAVGLFNNVHELQLQGAATNALLSAQQKDMQNFVESQKNINEQMAVQTATLSANQASFDRRLQLVEERDASGK